MDTHACACGCGTKIPLRSKNRTKLYYAFGHRNRKYQPVWKKEKRGFKTMCWVWQGYISSQGYAYRQIDKKKVRIHRLHYEQVYGAIPTGKVIDHLCRVRNCVNPKHLDLVTPAINTQRSEQTKLSWSKVREMRNRNKNGESMYSLAKEFGVQKSTAASAIRGHTWKD